MKSRGPVSVPGNTPWERLDNAVRSVFSVPKDQVLKEEAKAKRKQKTKRKPTQKRPT